MPTWAWILIGVVIAAVVVTVVLVALSRRRSDRLRQRFGPEYDRTVSERGSRSDAEKELSAREERRQQLQLRSLSPEARERYSREWQATQEQFVDSPAAAVSSADSLIQSVMVDRGYPMGDFERRAADISVDHPDVVQNYREAHRLSERSAAGRGSTEDLRKAMQLYRSLFEELMQPDVREARAA
jgi:hypothetical protein